jgi:hypothetical protein
MNTQIQIQENIDSLKSGRNIEFTRLIEMREAALDIVPAVRRNVHKQCPVQGHVDVRMIWARYCECATRELIAPKRTMEQMQACRLIQELATYVFTVKLV